MELVEVGKKAPDFNMMDVSGKNGKLSEKYRNSKYLLLDFWASHCGPCRKENRNIRQAYDRFHEKGFDVLGVSTDTRKEHWINAIETDKLIWTNVCSLEPWNENEVVRMYALRQVSQNFLLDNSGKIIATELRGEELIATLEDCSTRRFQDTLDHTAFFASICIVSPRAIMKRMKASQRPWLPISPARI